MNFREAVGLAALDPPYSFIQTQTLIGPAILSTVLWQEPTIGVEWTDWGSSPSNVGAGQIEIAPTREDLSCKPYE